MAKRTNRKAQREYKYFRVLETYIDGLVIASDRGRNTIQTSDYVSRSNLVGFKDKNLPGGMALYLAKT